MFGDSMTDSDHDKNIESIESPTDTKGHISS